MIKRLFDVSLSLLCLILFFIPALIIALIIKKTSPGPVLFWSQRVGKHNTPFWMPKFRTMENMTPVVATNQLINPESYLIDSGHVLRKLSLDEIPQLWCILKGDMSFVGPRPVLNDVTEQNLIRLRTQYGVSQIKPGLTGWAQINGRDLLDDDQKVNYDAHYMDNQGILFDLKIIFVTIIKVLNSSDVRH